MLGIFDVVFVRGAGRYTSNGRGKGGKGGLSAYAGSCRRHISAARSQACHMWWLWVGGRRGKQTGVQLQERMIRSASR